MNVKNILKGVDFKGLALQHCEKAAIAITTALLVIFLVSGFKKAMSASDIKPEQISKLAVALTDSVNNSKWDSSDDKSKVKNPDLDKQIKELETPIDSDQFVMSSRPFYFNFWDYGGILRGKPEILKPYNAIAVADKGAVSLYKTDAKGNIEMEERAIRQAPKKKAADKEEEPAKKKKQAAPSKSGVASRGGRGGATSGGSMEDGDSMVGGMGGGMMGGGSSRGMAMGPRMGMGGMGMGGMGMGMGGGGQGAEGSRLGGGVGDDSESDEIGGNIGAGQVKKSGGIRRNTARQDDDDQFAGDELPAKAGAAPGQAGLAGKAADPKVPLTRKVEVEAIRGIHWAVITALYPHRDQVKEYLAKLVDEPPIYKMVMVERREVLSDGSMSEWSQIDLKKQVEITRVIPKKKRTPENQDLLAAKAVFDGLVMPLPELVAGRWTFHNQKAAWEAALAVSARGGGGRGMVGNEMDGEVDESTQDQLNSELFNSGIPGAGRRGGGGMGAATQSVGLDSAGGGGYPGSGGDGRSMSMGAAPGMGQSQGMGMGQNYGMGGNNPRSGQPGGGANQTTGTTKDQAKSLQRCDAELVQIRFIDYTVEPEHTYQYRLKVKVQNPNVVISTNKEGKEIFEPRIDLISLDVGAEKDLTSKDWSEPTLPVYVPADTEYYILEKIKTREEAKMQVHMWKKELGEWQFADFLIKPGDPIGSEVRDYPFVGFDDVQKKIRFDFSTQDLLLDVAGGDKKFVFVVDGVEKTFNEPLPAEIFVIDRLGDLVNRNEDFDKHSAERKEREAQILALRKDAEKESKKPSSKTTETSEGFDERVPSRKGGSAGSAGSNN
jgi:hypothetical protein